MLILFLSLALLNSHAETRQDREFMRHELSIGWGDQLFETLIWQNPTYIVTTMPESFRETYHEDYHHNQHVWFQYQHRPNYWFSYGALIDFSHVGWTDVTRDGKGQEISRDPNRYFYNLLLMPTIRFTYVHYANFNMYFGLGFGMGINGGTETNVADKKTDIGAAASISLIGLSANYQRWFWALDLGGVYSLKDLNTVFLLSSEMIRAGLGVRF